MDNQDKKIEINTETITNLFDAMLKSIPETNYPNYAYDFVDAEKILELFFDKYFLYEEGGGCCHDKSAYVSRKIIKGLKNDEIYSLRETYGEYRDRGGDIGNIDEVDKIAYWCPKTLKDTKAALDMFIMHILGYGNENHND